MQAKFGIERERQNRLFHKSYKNDKGAFHFHSQIELYFVDKGEMEVTVNNRSRLLKANEMSVALSFDAHSYKTPKSSESSVLIIPSYMCEEFISAFQHKRVTNPFITNKDAVKQIKSCIREISKGGINDIKLQGYIYVILGTVMENLCFETVSEALEPDLSSKLLFFINDNSKSDISLTTLSHHFGYSESYLSRYFKSYFNIGISQYVSMVRLKNAVMLMHENKGNITYCALESGFNSVRTFYRAFYNEFNCSPKEYFETEKPVL